MPLVDVRIRGDDGNDAPWDGKSVGEIQVRGPFITGSYHRVAPSEDKFTDDGWLRTGDVAAMDELGFVRITDRTKDLIKSGGEWISSVDLENALMAHPAIAEAAVIAIPDPKWSERPLACIVWKKGAADRACRRRRHARQAPARTRLRQVAAARTLRGDRRRAAHLDRQVLEAEAARALPALGGLARFQARAQVDRRPRRRAAVVDRDVDQHFLRQRAERLLQLVVAERVRERAGAPRS